MFHRRRRSASVTGQNATPSAPAQSAATQAFMASKPSISNLQESAAAAALKASSRAPTPISGVETKRMVQRQASSGSRRGDSRPLNRRSSSGSMTDRTFRTPSPNRPAQGNGLADAPPVPPLPHSYNKDLSHRRAASMEPLLRMTSPPSSAKGGRADSLDRSPIVTSKPHQQHRPNFPDGNELERSDSQGSVNFSYPTAARPGSPSSPSQEPEAKNRTRVNMSRQAANDIHDTLNEKATASVRKKKPKASQGLTEGRYLANGGMRDRPTGTALGIAEGSGELNQARGKRSSQPDETVSAGDVGHAYSDSLEYAADTNTGTPAAKAKRTQRASGGLNKRPSVVREDWDGEQIDTPPTAHEKKLSEHSASGPASRHEVRQGKKETVVPNSSKKMIETSDASMKSARPSPQLITDLPAATSQQSEAPIRAHLGVEEDTVRPTRQTSVSPSRSTRFSAQLASEFSGRPRHQPPGRSVSPAKSALKHHSPSPQPASPTDGATGTRCKRSSQASSEASDNTSVLSADGFGIRSQMKKSLRVSFEADPEVVGAGADSEPSIYTSQQRKDPLKKNLAVRPTGNHPDSISAEDDMEGFLKPRPVLPSFGSVRPRRDDYTERSTTLAEVASPGSSESSLTSNPAMVESVVSRKYPTPVVVADKTRMKLTGPEEPFWEPGASIISSGVAEGADRAIPGNSDSKRHVATAATIRPETAPSVPSIAIQPATPGFDSSKPQDEWLVELPGSFPELPGRGNLIQDTSPIKHTSRNDGDSDIRSSQNMGIFEPSAIQAASSEKDPAAQAGSSHDALSRQAAEESDRESTSSSVYSDAAEDLSDLEVGDGFGSINAIVESPVVGTAAHNQTSPPDSPLAADMDIENPVGRTAPQPWDKVESHWKNLAQITRSDDRQQERSKPPPPAEKRRKKKPFIERDVTLVPQSLPKDVHQSSPSPRLEKTKASSPGQGQFKQSMRAQTKESKPGHGFRSSMRPSKQTNSQIHDHPPAISPKGASQKKARVSPPFPTQVAPPSAKSVPVRLRGANKSLERRVSAGSDSSSSFKKVQRPTSSGGRSTMRTSMRSSGTRSMVTPTSQRGGVRSASPPSRRPFSAHGEDGMKRTMRGSADAAVPSLRSSTQQRPSSSLSGFVKPRSKAKASAPPSSTSRFKSRFADSDDDEPSPRKFSSRFDDSSDDGREVSTLRPVRGIPRKPGGDDSTDLEDSSDDGRKQAATKRQSIPRSPGAANGVNGKLEGIPLPLTVAEPTPSPTNAKKKGFLSRFRNRKASGPTNPTPPASPDTEAERQQEKMHVRVSSPQSVSFPESRGKLQRRNVQQRTTSDSWPLPPRSSLNEDRPNTSDVMMNTNGLNHLPDSSNQQDNLGTIDTETGIAPLERSEKKKRFPLLRKAFRL